VNTINFTDKTWLDKVGNFHSADLHVTERYALTGPNTLQYEARLEDPNVHAAVDHPPHGRPPHGIGLPSTRR